VPPDLEDEPPNNVEVPETLQPLDEVAWLELNESIDINRPSAYHGVDIYSEVLQFIVQRHARQNNN
jgi:hypothetical protein